MSPASVRSGDPTSEGPIVLVVDDEIELRKILERVLEQIGYRVLTVESALHAIDVLLEPGLDIACVVSDQKMAGPNGVSLLDYVAEHFPRTGRVIFSGNFGPDLALASARHEVVEKATPPRVLIDAIARAIRNARSEP